MSKKAPFNPNNVRFTHVRGDLDPLGGAAATIAFTTDTKENGETVHYAGVAYVHPNDNFNRYLGRVKSNGRLVQVTSGTESADNQKYFKEENVSFEDFYEMVLEEVEAFVPVRVAG